MRNFSCFLGLALVVVSATLARPAAAVEGFFIGGKIGYVAPSSKAPATVDGALGFGVDLGTRVNSFVDLSYSGQYSSHKSGGSDLDIFANTLNVDFRLIDVNDFVITLGGGPGLYVFKAKSVLGNASNTNFGLQGGAGAAIWVEEHLRIGVDFRYHGIFGTVKPVDGYFTVMAGIGYLFGG